MMMLIKTDSEKGRVGLLLFIWINSIFTSSASPIFTDNNEENEVLKPKYAHLSSLKDAWLESGFYDAVAGEDMSGIPERHGESNDSSSCTEIRHVPSDVGQEGIYRYYKKYTEAYNIPVLASEYVSNEAMQRACYGVRFMFADQVEIRDAFFKGYGRVVVLATGEKLTSLPEYGEILPKNYDSLRAIGGAASMPVVVVAEELLDCRAPEDMLIRELAIGVVNIALPRLRRGLNFLQRLNSHYNWVIASGKWSNTAASLSPQTYIGEGFQSYFDVNQYADPPDGLHNMIAWRQALIMYDPRLFNLIRELKSCGNNYQYNCRGVEDLQLLRMNCPVQSWPVK